MMVPAKPSLEILHRLDLFAEPAAHLCAGRSRRNSDAAIFLEQVVEQLLPVAGEQPGNMLARVEAERQRRAEGEGRILAPVIIQRGVAHLDRSVRDGIQHLQAGDDFAGGKGLDLEFVVGDLGDALAEIFAAAIERIERLRPACSQTPAYLGHRFRDRRRSDRACGETDAANFQKFTTFHAFPSLVPMVRWPMAILSVALAHRRRMLTDIRNRLRSAGQDGQSGAANQGRHGLRSCTKARQVNAGITLFGRTLLPSTCVS